MNRACSRSKARVKKDECGKKSRSNTDSDVKCDSSEVNSARILHENDTSAAVKENDCDDALEQPLCSQESFLEASQEIGCNREVRWDYRSPETIKRLRKCRGGQYSSEEVRKIVDVFNDTDVKSEDSLLHSVKLYISVQDETTFSRLGNQSKPRERVVKKYKQRALNKDSVQHMLTILKEQAEKPKTDCRKKLKRLSDGSSAHGPEVCDGSNSTCASVSGICDGSGAGVSGICNGSDLTSASTIDVRDRSDVSTSPVQSQSVENKDDSFWSDEDLFKDNSFILEATQNPEKFLAAAAQQRSSLVEPEKRKISAAGDELASQVDDPVCHQTLFGDSFVIPPSCTSNQSSALGVKPSGKVPPASSSSLSSGTAKAAYAFKNVQTSGIPGKISSFSEKNLQAKSTLKTGQSLQTHGTASSRVSTTGPRSCNLNSNCGDKQAVQNSQSVIVNPAPDGKYKTSFRKFGSFNDSSPTASQNDCGGFKRNGNSNNNLSFRKTLSFDSSVSSSRPEHRLDMKPVPDFSSNCVKPKFSISHDSRSEKRDVAASELLEPVRVPSMPAVQDDGFDISLPDELFQKLLEEDDILDSQASAISTASTMNLLPVKTTSLCDTSSGIGLETSSFSKLKLDAKTSYTASKSSFINSAASHIGSETSLSKVNLGCKKSSTALKPTFTNNCTVSSGATNNVKKDGKGAIPKVSKQQVTTSKPPTSKPPTSKPTTSKPPQCLLSPVRPVAGLHNKHKLSKNSPVHAYYKKTFSLQQRSSPRRGKSENIQQSLPSSSTPVKGSNRDGSDDGQESSLDSLFDDSFSNDQVLFESQIVPFLEQVEAEEVSTQNEPSVLEPSVLEPSVLTKCSSKEIEQKRQAALQKRHQKLSQSKKASNIK